MPVVGVGNLQYHVGGGHATQAVVLNGVLEPCDDGLAHGQQTLEHWPRHTLRHKTHTHQGCGAARLEQVCVVVLVRRLSSVD